MSKRITSEIRHFWLLVGSVFVVGMVVGIVGVCGLSYLGGRFAYLPALLGDPERQYEYGKYLYNQGHNKEAVTWFTKAADVNQTDAMLRLGMMFSNMEIGVYPDKERALSYTLEAAELGNPYAMVMTALLYENFKDKKPNASKNALYWYTQAAFQGMTPAIERLIAVYGKGELGEKASPKQEQYWKEKMKGLTPSGVFK